jgi:hypothetical protein
MRGKRGFAIASDTMIYWILGLLILGLLVIAIFVLNGKASGAISFIKDMIRIKA